MKSLILDDLMVIVFTGTDFNSRNLYKSVESIYEGIDDYSLVILDLSNIKYLRSDAVGSLIYLQNIIKEKNKNLKMYQNKKQILDIYHRLKLDKVISMIDKDNNETDDFVYYLD